MILSWPRAGMILSYRTTETGERERGREWFRSNLAGLAAVFSVARGSSLSSLSRVITNFVADLW